MASANKLKRLLADAYGRLRISGHTLSLAIEAGAFAPLQSPNESPQTFWSGPIVSKTPRMERFPGTPGGMVWRHLAAIASWEGLLLRVDTLLGPQARETVARLRLRDENEDTSAFEVTSEVVAKTLANPGFAEFVKNRFADNSVVNALFERARGTITSPSTSTYSATCDFIADFLFRSFGDFCG